MRPYGASSKVLSDIGHADVHVIMKHGLAVSKGRGRAYGSAASKASARRRIKRAGRAAGKAECSCF